MLPGLLGRGDESTLGQNTVVGGGCCSGELERAARQREDDNGIPLMVM